MEIPQAHYCLSWPSKSAMKRVRQKIKTVTAAWRRLQYPLESIVGTLNPILRGWVNYFRVGNSSLKFQALDRYIFDRTALFRRRKYRLHRKSWATEEYQRLGVFRASGHVAWV